MLVLGIETSCDETGVALYHTGHESEGRFASANESEGRFASANESEGRFASANESEGRFASSGAGLLGHALHTQASMHEEYGGVVPELASRDHVRRLLPLLDVLWRRCAPQLEQLYGSAALSGMHSGQEHSHYLEGKYNGIHLIDAVAYTRGPGLAGALLVGAAFANALAFALNKPAIGIHHLEGHLLSPLLANPKPAFPFIALLVSGGHSQIMRVAGIGQYETLGDTLDDAAGEAFDKTAKLLGLGYPGGPALAKLAANGNATRFKLPRPMLNSGDLDFSFSGLKTAVRTLIEKHGLIAEPEASGAGVALGGLDNSIDMNRSDLAAGVQAAIVDVLVAKSVMAVQMTGVRELVVAGGVGANQRLREKLQASATQHGFRVYYPPLEYCTDNGAMIALAGCLRLSASSVGETCDPTGALRLSAGDERHGSADRSKSERATSYRFTVAPRWDLSSLPVPGA